MRWLDKFVLGVLASVTTLALLACAAELHKQTALLENIEAWQSLQSSTLIDSRVALEMLANETLIRGSKP